MEFSFLIAFVFSFFFLMEYGFSIFRVLIEIEQYQENSVNNNHITYEENDVENNTTQIPHC